jgi:hypothetical protein
MALKTEYEDEDDDEYDIEKRSWCRKKSPVKIAGLKLALKK